MPPLPFVTPAGARLPTQRVPAASWPARLCASLSVVLLASLLTAAPVWASDLDRAQALWLQGQHQQALQTVQTALKLAPNDARLRFAQAVMQTGLGQLSEAEAGLVALTQDNPDLADPYNNLAVLYAGRGELERAREALEQALRLQPEHALAQENLGDVLIRLSLRAYERALASGSGDRPALELKLQALRGMLKPQEPAPRRAAGTE